MRTKANPSRETVSQETPRLKGKTFSRLCRLSLKQADKENEKSPEKYETKKLLKKKKKKKE